MSTHAALLACVCALLSAAACDGGEADASSSCEADASSSCENGVGALRGFYNAYPFPPNLAHGRDVNLHVTGSLDHLEHFALRSNWRDPRAKAPLRVLVVPCAQGNDAVQLATQLRQAHLSAGAAPKALGEVVCADLSNVSLASSAARFENTRERLDEYISILEVDLLQLHPRRHGSFDYILSSGVLHHLPSPEAGIRALRGVLAPGGVLGVMVHASHGMHAVVEVHTLLQQAAPPTLDYGSRLAMARALARGLLHRLPEALRANLEFHLEDDHLTADFYLTPYQRAYTVRELGGLLATAELCMVRPEPAWRYDVAHVLAAPNARRKALEATGALSGLSALANASLADEFWAQAINHRFLARPAEGAEIGGLCPPSEPRDPRSSSLGPVWAWWNMGSMLRGALREDNATLRAELLLRLVSPGGFGHLTPDNLEGAMEQHPAPIREHIARELDALPADAAEFVEAVVGCDSFAKLLGREPTEADVRMYRTLEAFYGLRLTVLADSAEACRDFSRIRL